MTTTTTRARIIGTTPLFVVSDLARSMAFYWEKLGFGPPNAWGEPPCFAMVRRSGYEIMLNLAEKPEAIRPNGPGGIWDMYIRVDDVAAEIDALNAAGVEIVRGPETMFYQMREIEVLDPDGYRICIAQDATGTEHESKSTCE